MHVLWLLAVPALVALALVAFNLLAWPRGRADSTHDESGASGAGGVLGRVSILVPARNEALNIEACVRAACALPVAEVVVFDDGSDDDTPGILRRLAAELPSLRVVRGDGALPAGWVGKAHACACLQQEARGDSLWFVDADVVVEAGALGRLASLVSDLGADIVTAVPRQRMVTAAEQLVLPLLHLTYLAWLPLPLIWRTRDPRFLAANGQLLWLRRETLLALGGFERIKGEIVDDMALCRAAKLAGRRVVFADGTRLASCRMYRSAGDVVAGFSKNLHEGVGSTVGVVGAVGVNVVAFVVPALLLPFFPAPPVVAAVVAGLLARVLLVLRFGHPLWSAVLFPVGVVAIAAIAANSLRWSARGAIAWKGRQYAPRAARVSPAARVHPTAARDRVTS